MNFNLYFLSLTAATVLLVGLGYVILNPQSFGFCRDTVLELQCVGEGVYFGLGYTFFNSLYPYIALFAALTVIPIQYLRYWFRIILPFMLLSVLAAYLAPASRQNMFDMSRSDVVYEAGMYLLVLTVVVVGCTYVKLEVERRFRGKK